MSYEGNRDLKYRDGSNEYDLFISLDEFDRKSKADIENISFVNHSGQLIKLSQVADISEGESPSTLIRYNKLPSCSYIGQLSWYNYRHGWRRNKSPACQNGKTDRSRGGLCRRYGTSE